MALAAPDVERSGLGLHSLEQYEPLIGAAATERIFRKADALRILHVVHASSTFYGGGVAEILTPLTLMMNAAGIETGWRIIQGTAAFFSCTKKLHNALQGDSIALSDADKSIYEQVEFENALRLHLDECDAVIVHDPQPLGVQVSRFDRWKDPLGVIDAFRKARREADCTLVLLGNSATDDPEGEVVLETIRNTIDESIVVRTVDDPTLVNALQRRAAVVLQKSLREGFGLTVTEAMWKGAAVIGGNVGGIRLQIRDGENGFLVDTVDQAADRIVQLLRDPKLRQRIGAQARETVREKFLMSRLLE